MEKISLFFSNLLVNFLWPSQNISILNLSKPYPGFFLATSLMKLILLSFYRHIKVEETLDKLELQLTLELWYTEEAIGLTNVAAVPLQSSSSSSSIASTNG